MSRLWGDLLRRLRTYCDASNDIWLIARSAEPRGARWCLAVCLWMCQSSSLLPPPPRCSGPLRMLGLACSFAAALCVTAGNQHRLLTGVKENTAGYSTLSRVAFVSSTVMTAVQPFVILGNNAAHFRAFAPHVAALLLPPLRFRSMFVVSGSVMMAILFGKHDVNSRLAGLAAERPELRALVLETAARQYELTADQVGALGSLGTMGLPLACNSIRHRVKLVTDSFLVYRNIEKVAKLAPGTIPALLLQMAASVQRILATAVAGERLQCESRRTESVLGAINSSAWPARERLLVERILRNSRRGVAWSMGGLERIGHGYLLSVIGSTVTYLVVLMQYRDPGEGDA